jgi:hypothetical protein
MHPPDDFAREFGVEKLETRSDCLLGLVSGPGFLRRLATLAMGSPGDEFRVSLQKSEVDLAHALGEQVTTSISGAAVAASGQFDQSRLREVEAGGSNGDRNTNNYSILVRTVG